MGKKSKKKSQKNRQAKSLKRRTQKKVIKKKMPKRKMPHVGGMPGNLPPGADKMMRFAEPLAMMANPQDMASMQELAGIMQGLWSALAFQDMTLRAEKLAPVKTLYEAAGWAEIPWDEFSELMLRRHIVCLPKSHSDEERAAYSQESLDEAMAFSIESDAVDDVEIAPIDLPEFDRDTALTLLDEAAQASLAKLHGFLEDHHAGIDFSQPDSPAYRMLMDFQQQVPELYSAYLQHTGADEVTAAVHVGNVTPLLKPFLSDAHQAHLYNCTADQVEEYLLDYYLRKLNLPPAARDVATTSLAGFFALVKAMDYREDADEILVRIAEVSEEYEDLLAHEREQAAAADAE